MERFHVIPAQAAVIVIPAKAAVFVIPAQAAVFVIPAKAGIQTQYENVNRNRNSGPQPPLG